ncbi:MAG: hypothetical protein KDB01_15315 [Planctomycetaceae bacterium]|nr:hypothetical protein [Planctomycetaceae bacterium]
MHSVCEPNGAHSSTQPAESLFAVLNDLLRAVAGRVAVLRSLPSNFDCEQDDIDLLLTAAQRRQLVQAAFTQCIRGRIHCRIQQSSAAKAQMLLWTIDCSQMLIVDLWSGFDQLLRHRHHWIPADRLLNTLSSAERETRGERVGETDPTVEHAEATRPGWCHAEIPALRQLPPDISLCLLIQHLATKRKKLTTTGRHERIVVACDRLKNWSPTPELQNSLLPALRGIAEQLPRAIIITPRCIEFSEDYLLQRLAASHHNRGLPLLERRHRRGLITEFRKLLLQHRPVLALIGSDGAGKSSVISALATQQPEATRVVARKYYRRSLAYQLASGLMKRLCGLDRGVFDDYFSPLITLRAAAGLWTQMCLRFRGWSRAHQDSTVAGNPIDNRKCITARAMLLDRSLASFLITDRKSDVPRLTRSARWIEWIIPPVSSLLLTLPYHRLKVRKQEMSLPGHEAYQHLLFEQALRQRPVDLMMTASLASAETTAAAVTAMSQGVLHRVQQPIAVSDDRKAVA